MTPRAAPTCSREPSLFNPWRSMCVGGSRSPCTVSVMRPWCRRDVTTAEGTERVRLWVPFLPLAPRARIRGQEGAVLDPDQTAPLGAGGRSEPPHTSEPQNPRPAHRCLHLTTPSSPQGPGDPPPQGGRLGWRRDRGGGSWPGNSGGEAAPWRRGGAAQHTGRG